eukprot:TRINITY_DN32950_c0_g1_i1.p1 TRINITY_DN32950_c0_g1~~TRINITY_DN32950_c0_g1_i1.p1  ORF type:complete len:1002 (+),score=183.50 TRINITY_DN32950_c0_g1_i1:130-3135(+)
MAYRRLLSNAFVLKPALFASILVSTFLRPCSALYEDQVGVVDWHQQYIGKVKQSVFHTQKSGRKRVVVLTEENVIASLNLRKGEIFWRHVLAQADIVDGIEIALGRYVISLSSSGSIVRAWNLPDGQMVWETFLEGSTSSKSLLCVPGSIKNEKEGSIFVYGGGWLNAVSSFGGDILWRTKLPIESDESQTTIEKIALSHKQDHIYVVGFVGKEKVAVWVVDSANGQIIKSNKVVVARGISVDNVLVTDNHFVALDDERSTIITGSISERETVLHTTSISTFLDQSAGPGELLPLKFSNAFALKTKSCILLIKIGKAYDDIYLFDKIGTASIISDGLILTPEQQAFAVVEHLGGGKVSLVIKLDSSEKTEILREVVQLDAHKGYLEKVFINNYVRTDMSYGFRALVVGEDESLALLQQGEVVWSREDGLAGIIDVSTAELPVERDGVSVAKVEHNLFEWLKGHFLKLKATLLLASSEEMAVIQEMRLNNADKTKMTRDHNGFRKLLIVLTRGGKLLALHSGDGRIVWSLLLPAFRKSEQCQAPFVLKALPWRVPHHHALDESPVTLVVGKCNSVLNAPGILSFVDSHSGEEIQTYRLPYHIAQVIPLEMTDSTEQRLHLLIDDKVKAHLLPRTDEALSIFLKIMQSVFFYHIDKDKGRITGYGIDIWDKSDVATQDYCFKTRELWSIVLPSDMEKIIVTAVRAPDEVVHTQAKILADQEVLYKYINKNVLFVVTVAPKASGPIGSVLPEEAWLVAYIIDTVTGRILHRVTHQAAQGPVHAVFSENWVIYHYFNLRTHRFEMSVIEIYDRSRLDNKNVIELMLGRHNLSAPVSSFSYVDIDTKSQSYAFSRSVRTIAATLTAKGITSKQILIGTIGDQVLTLDKRFFDPRRSRDPSPAEREDGILPLSEGIPIFPQSYITHSLQVEDLRGIITIPARLESTCLVFAYGVDLFYTRIAPSRTYDSLTEDFSYALLLITIVALVAAIVITWILSEKKELREKWR